MKRVLQHASVDSSDAATWGVCGLDMEERVEMSEKQCEDSWHSTTFVLSLDFNVNRPSKTHEEGDFGNEPRGLDCATSYLEKSRSRENTRGRGFYE